ncbi:MAG TPA: hypothetical protein VGI82_04345, partial [Chitinophagaceae bacterium]
MYLFSKVLQRYLLKGTLTKQEYDGYTTKNPGDNKTSPFFLTLARLPAVIGGNSMLALLDESKLF